MKSLFAAAVVVVTLISDVPAFSQSINGTISGTIEDASGAVLPGVSVTATNNATGVVTAVVTNEAGAYNFASLISGVYTVSAELPGFRSKTYKDVQLGNGQQL